MLSHLKEVYTQLLVDFRLLIGIKCVSSDKLHRIVIYQLETMAYIYIRKELNLKCL